MAETMTYDPGTDTVTTEGNLTPDEQESLKVGEAMQEQQEQLLAGKYKDAADLEKAYIELQKKLGEDGTEEKAEVAESEAEPEEVSESLDIDEKLVLDKIEPEPLQPVPERNYSFESKPSAETESLINRLKYFQENLDARSHHLDKGDTFSAPEPTSKNLVGEPRFVEQQSITPKSPRISPEDNKKYIEVLESFIFLKDQNKH